MAQRGNRGRNPEPDPERPVPPAPAGHEQGGTVRRQARTNGFGQDCGQATPDTLRTTRLRPRAHSAEGTRDASDRLRPERADRGRFSRATRTTRPSVTSCTAPGPTCSTPHRLRLAGTGTRAPATRTHPAPARKNARGGRDRTRDERLRPDGPPQAYPGTRFRTSPTAPKAPDGALLAASRPGGRKSLGGTPSSLRLPCAVAVRRSRPRGRVSDALRRSTRQPQAPATSVAGPDEASRAWQVSTRRQDAVRTTRLRADGAVDGQGCREPLQRHRTAARTGPPRFAPGATTGAWTSRTASAECVAGKRTTEARSADRAGFRPRAGEARQPSGWKPRTSTALGR